MHAQADKSFKPTPYEGAGDLQSPKLLQRLRIASKFRVEPLGGPHAAVTSEGYAGYNYNPIDSFLEVPDRYSFTHLLIHSIFNQIFAC